MSRPQMLTVGEEHSVSEAAEQAMVWNPFAQDMMFAAVWRIAREPTCGTPLKLSTNPPRRLLHMMSNTVAKSPALLVRYYVLEHKAIVDWVKFLPYDADQAVSPEAFSL